MYPLLCIDEAESQNSLPGMFPVSGSPQERFLCKFWKTEIRQQSLSNSHMLLIRCLIAELQSNRGSAFVPLSLDPPVVSLHQIHMCFTLS